MRILLDDIKQFIPFCNAVKVEYVTEELQFQSNFSITMHAKTVQNY